ncbi:hypothetical protein [Streptomyces sp. NPDC000410]|uniref:hypothetical protein n=1 Tax=Streptomyces sp. NPDC000410 TaxID=3154254 RepID=UPI00331D9826
MLFLLTDRGPGGLDEDHPDTPLHSLMDRLRQRRAPLRARWRVVVDAAGGRRLESRWAREN